MKKITQRITWFVFGSLCLVVGFYPVIYFLIDPKFGLLSSKNQELLSNHIWNTGFYGHIVLGGIALLIGWTQFSSRLRRKRIKLHKTIGKIYVIAVIISAICGIYIAQFATGGITNVIGFSLSGLVWLTTTLLAYSAIKKERLNVIKTL